MITTIANKALPLDRAGMMVFETSRSLRPARQVNAVVWRHTKDWFEMS